MGKYWDCCRQKIHSLIQKSSGQQDYSDYVMKPAEIVEELVKGLGILLLFAYVFYRSWLAFILLLPALIPYLHTRKKKKIAHRKEKLTVEFREMMYSLIAGLQAGYSVENAFRRSYQDMRLLYGENGMMVKELEYMIRELRNNINIEELLEDLARRSGVQDIRDFAEVFHIVKRSGGDMPMILKDTADLINDRIEVKREINTVISAKKMEQMIMDFVPFGIILYIDASTPGFFDALYHNAMGVIFMTVLLGVYLGAYGLAQKILEGAVKEI